MLPNSPNVLMAASAPRELSDKSVVVVRRARAGRPGRRGRARPVARRRGERTRRARGARARAHRRGHRGRRDDAEEAAASTAATPVGFVDEEPRGLGRAGGDARGRARGARRRGRARYPDRRRRRAAGTRAGSPALAPGRRGRVLARRPARLLVADRGASAGRGPAPPRAPCGHAEVRHAPTSGRGGLHPAALAAADAAAAARARAATARAALGGCPPAPAGRPPSGSGCRRWATCSSTSRATAGRARSIGAGPGRGRDGGRRGALDHVAPVRRRGMKPLVEARVADDRDDDGDVLQPAVAGAPYRPGRGCCCRASTRARSGFRVNEHAETGEEVAAAGDEVATYPATEGLSSAQIAALVHEHRGRIARRARAAAGAAARRSSGCRTAPPRSTPPTSATTRAAAGGSRSTSCCCSRSRCCAAAQPPRGRPRRRARAARRADRALAGDSLPFTPTGDQRKAMEAVDDDVAARPADAAAADGRGRLGQDRRRAVRDAARGRAGAQAALMAPTETLAEQHFATLQKLMPGELVQAALLTGSTPAGRRADLLGKLASGELKLLVGTHALIEDPRRVRPPGGGRGRRAAPLRRQPAPRAGPQGARRGLAPHILHMTATPIPRTLALTAYGDLDVTVLRELPGGPPADRDLRRLHRARARPRLRAHPRGAATPAARRSSSARWSRSPRRSRRAPPPPSTSGCKGGELKDYRVVLMHGQMRPRQAGGDGGVRRGRRRRARGHDRDRGRHRRPERDRDAGRGRRALRALPAAPAARADRPRRARVAVPAVRPQGLAPPARAAPSTATASSWPRSTSSCAARARCSASASPACRRSGSPACRRTSSCSSAPAAGRARSSTPTRSCAPEHAADRGRDRTRLRRRRARADPA